MEENCHGDIVSTVWSVARINSQRSNINSIFSVHLSLWIHDDTCNEFIATDNRNLNRILSVGVGYCKNDTQGNVVQGR